MRGQGSKPAGRPSRRAFLELAGATAAIPYWGGCGRRRTTRRIDEAWFREKLAEDTERSLKTAVHPSGFLGRVGTPAARQGAAVPGRSRSPGMGAGSPTSLGRNMTALSFGFDLTRQPEIKEVLRKAAGFMMRHMWDHEYGGLYQGVDPADGKVVNDRKESYGMAAAILGMARAAEVTGEEEHRDAALNIWAGMKKGLQDGHGFFKRDTSRDFKVAGTGKNTQNPLMHLFEGLLGLYDTTKSTEVMREAQDLADRVLARLMQPPGYIPELYDAEWRPIPAGPPGQREPDGGPLDIYNAYSEAAQTGHVEVGHCIEWAYFLSRAVERGFPDSYLAPAERLIEFVLKVGVDAETGGIYGYTDYNGNRTQASATSGWQIQEFVRMAAHWAVLRGRQDLWEPYDRAVAAIKNSGSAPAGYHGCGMCAEVVRLAALPA